MIAVLVRLPTRLLEQTDLLCEEIYSSRSQFIRQSIIRNIEIIRQCERPAIMEFYRKRIPNPNLH
jgi:metal-responsive CopG/Arc/MetJ family transcriptional regulator